MSQHPSDRDLNVSSGKGAGVDRRSFVQGAVAAAGAAMLPSSAFAKGASLARDGASRDAGYTIPDSAYVRTLGAVPQGVCNVQTCSNGIGRPGLKAFGAGLSVPGLGLPLGGVGGGSMMINQCGTFGPWDMGGEPTVENWEQRTLTQAAFHVREEVVGGGSAPTLKTLAVNHANPSPDRRLGNVLPEWSPLNPGDGEFAVLYPFAWARYGGFQAHIATKMWSPIMSNEDERLSMPVAFFEMRVSNPTSRSIKLAAMFTFPNAPAFASGSTRSGLYNKVDFDPGSRITGVTLGSDAPENSSNAMKSEWTIAAQPAPGQVVSHCSSWNGEGDGSDIYSAFAADGTLPNGSIETTPTSTAGAIAVNLTLQPGQSRTVRFALAWDFPQQVYNSTIWMRRYTAFLGGRTTATNDYVAGSYPFKQGFTIARRELSRYDDSLAAVEAWWKPVALNTAVPAWLRKASLNELYHMTFNGALWESGLVSTGLQGSVAQGNSPRWGSDIPGTHIYYHRDGGNGGTRQNEMDMDSAGWLVFSKLFRSMERGFILPYLQGVKQNPIGIGRVAQQTFTANGPYITSTMTFQRLPVTSPPIPGVAPVGNDLGALFDTQGGDSFRDCPHKLIYRTYGLIKFYNDDDLLRYAYPMLLRALTYSQAFRPTGSHLPSDPPSNNPPNTIDQSPVDGHGIYNCQLYLLSLQIMATITARARRLGVAEATIVQQRSLDTELTAAKAEFERIFWNAATGRYRYCDGTGGIQGRTGRIRTVVKSVPPPDAIWLESFPGQCAAMELGLPDIMNMDRARSHLNNTLDHFLRFRDPQGRLMGAPTVLLPDFSVYTTGTEINEVLPGVVFYAAAAAYRIGKRFNDTAIMTKALQLGEGCAIRMYDDQNAGLAFNSPESWFINDTSVSRFPAYTRTRSVWSLLDAVSPLGVQQPG